MCLIVFAYQAHPDFRLVLAANRDEYFARPTLRADYWEGERNILAGVDRLQGGTWLGINKDLKFAAVTNYRGKDSPGEGAISRGLLVGDYLSGDAAALDYVNKSRATKNRYAGYNFLAGDEHNLCFTSNYDDRVNVLAPGIYGNVLAPGIYGISNGRFAARWPKIIRAKERLKKALTRDKKIDIDSLFLLLRDQSIPDDSELPDTGVGIEMERKLAPGFVTLGEYGRRSSTVMTIDKYGSVYFSECSYDKRRRDTGNVVYRFNQCARETRMNSAPPTENQS